MKKILAFALNVSLIAFAIALSGCGGDFQPVDQIVPANGPSLVDDSVVRGIAVVTVTKNQQSVFSKFMNNYVLIPSVYAASTGTTAVTYNNAPSVTFTVNVASLTAGAMSGNTLPLGSVTVTALKDNDLKLCGIGGNQKCTQAIMRVYTTGTIAGFVNTSDTPNYGVPVYTSGLNPTTALTIGSPGVAVQQVTSMPSSKHTVLLSDFSSPTYNVSSDFLNAGTGAYSMTYVIEYALAP